jgi:hypothetical protein
MDMAKAKPAREPEPLNPAAVAGAAHAATYIGRFLEGNGRVNIARTAETLGLSKPQLAETVGLGVTTLSKSSRHGGAKAQARTREMLEIIARVRAWAGSDAHAMAWYRSEPIPALDGRTAEALVRGGEATAVREYLDHLALGGFA